MDERVKALSKLTNKKKRLAEKLETTKAEIAVVDKEIQEAAKKFAEPGV